MKILMTGASSGLGKHIQSRMLRHKHEVVTLGPDGDLACFFDELDDTHFVKISDWVRDRGPFDALCNCAGAMELNPTLKYTQQQWHRSMSVNLEMPLHLMKCMLTQDQDRFCRICNITSMAVRTPSRECIGYIASKAALEAVTRAMAKEFATTNCIFSCVAPCQIEGTQMQEQGYEWLVKHRGMEPAMARMYQNNTMLQRPAAKDEIARIVEFALVNMPHIMTGTVFTVPAGSGI